MWMNHIDYHCSLLSTGVYVIGFSYPVVPKGKARIRVQISAAHTDEDIDHCVDAFIQTGRKHGVIAWTGQKKKQEFSNQYELLNSIELLARADHVACETYEWCDGTIGYICRSTEVNVIFVSAYLNKVLLLTYVGLCILRKRLFKR